jgi:folate-binding Fe-S cluster repair protein YgfZ
VPRHLRRLTVPGQVPPAGAAIRTADGKDVGTLTSVAATGTGAIALGYLGRAVEVPAELVVAWDGATVGATAEALDPPTLAR